MTKRGGYFEVLNDTGSTITNVVGNHKAADHHETTTQAESLAQGTKTPLVPFATQETSKDYWNVSFVKSDGDIRTGEITCGIHAPEVYKLHVVIVLEEKGFKVVRPEGHGQCPGSYDQ
jgi:hypothetical protein